MTDTLSNLLANKIAHALNLVPDVSVIECSGPQRSAASRNHTGETA